VRLVYLPSFRRDLLWLRHYYERIFPDGAAGPQKHVRAAERLLLDNPYIGRPTHRDDVRRLPVARTPFFIVYRVSADRIEILRVIDGRSFKSMLD
jgi:toxin ParE1/3/4